MHSGRTRNQGNAQHWQKVTNGAYILSEIEKEVKSVVNWWVTENGRSGQENLDNKSFLEVREWDIQKDWGCLGRVSNFRRGTLPRVKVRLLMCMADVKAIAGEDPDHLGCDGPYVPWNTEEPWRNKAWFAGSSLSFSLYLTWCLVKEAH